MREFDRRGFLKVGSFCAANVTVGRLMLPIGQQVNRAVEANTDFHAGNAYGRVKIEEECKNEPNPDSCAQDYDLSLVDKINRIALIPAEEEVVYRTLTSTIVSLTEGSEDIRSDVLKGTLRTKEDLGMSRREVIAGTVSTVLFAARHNVTDKGFDTKTIPASQAVHGIVYWYLQRKFGVAANTIAHITNNFLTLR